MESMPEAMITKRKRKWKRKQQCFVGCELLLPPAVSIRSSVAAVVSGGGETGGRVAWNERLVVVLLWR